MNWWLDGNAVDHGIRGEEAPASFSPLIRGAVDLTQGTSWAEDGFVVVDAAEELNSRAKALVTERVLSTMRGAGCDVAADISLENYHERVASVPGSHARVVAVTGKYLRLDELEGLREEFEFIASEQAKRELSMRSPHSGESATAIRIVRPNSGDENPLHRDPWLPSLADGLNGYLPIAGSTERSSLALIPGSHHWPESVTVRTKEGAVVDGKRYHVPSVLRSERRLELVRPTVRRNSLMLFSPYLLHGASSNFEMDLTRVSLELRFYPSH